MNTARTPHFRISDTQFGILLALPALALFAAITIYPLLSSMYQGLLDKSLLYPGQEFVGLDNIQAILQDDFTPLLRTTLTFTIYATILPFVVGFAIALIMNSSIRGQALLRSLFLLPWLLPTVVVSFLWMWIFNANYGVLNGLLRVTGLIQENINWLGHPQRAMIAVIIAKTWNTFPWIMVMLLAGLQTIPKELHEAAAIDGAGRMRTFRHVTLPQLRGIIGTVLLLSIIWNFQHFETIYVMTTGGPAKATTTFSVAVYKAAFQKFDLGEAGAIGILWMILLSVVVAIYLKFGTDND
ncbi:MAG TPA: sugar ABC transporter permease [Aggregatilinea sp.]|uniref:carbohydrate ABC transporter permease n=1 Tax=Aggregatilinea sp. TaxID=2806333 RepID=UPI002C025250|nr:sugar ABC transporter permease [Aggregatilinea sp.]HML21636.1 sugar ABC transporter permease [Aggregatilinea sp.]